MGALTVKIACFVAAVALPGIAAAQQAGITGPAVLPQNRIMIFTEAAYHGRALSLGRDTADLGWLKFGQVGSFIIQQGVWQMCTQANYGGVCREFVQSERNLRRLPPVGPIMSIRRLVS